MTRFWEFNPPRAILRVRGRGLTESDVMAKGSNSRSNKEAKKPKKDKSKDKSKSGADSNAPVTIAGKQMK